MSAGVGASVGAGVDAGVDAGVGADVGAGVVPAVVAAPIVSASLVVTSSPGKMAEATVIAAVVSTSTFHMMTQPCSGG